MLSAKGPDGAVIDGWHICAQQRVELCSILNTTATRAPHSPAGRPMHGWAICEDDPERVGFYRRALRHVCFHT